MTDIAALLDQMTLEELVSLLSGEDFWSLPATPRLGIGKLRVTEGPNGPRGGGSLVGGVKSAAFPVGIAVGSFWNPELAREIGIALADEVKSKGAHVSLAPTANIQRSVTNGRNLECYSEEPVLTTYLAVAYIERLRGKQISATIKHFVGNQSEIERPTMSSDIDERTLREVYLIPFEAAMKRSGSGIMSSYDKVNGTCAAENAFTLTQVLRDDRAYDGVVMSDWFGFRTTAPKVNAGLDIGMPGPTRDRGGKLGAAVQANVISAAMVRLRAENMLRLMVRTGTISDRRPFVEHADDRVEHRALIRRAGAEGAVLANNDGILPLGKGARVALTGPNAKAAQITSGGSAQLRPHYAVSPWEGMSARGAAFTYAKGCTNDRFELLLTGDFTVEFHRSRAFQGVPVATETMTDLTAFWIS